MGADMQLSQPKVACAALALVGVLLTFLPVQGQEETVTLQHKLAQGETLTYAHSASTSDRSYVMISTETVNIVNSREVSGQQVISVKGVSANGTMTLEVVRALRITEKGRTRESSAQPAEVQLTPTGEILNSSGAKPTTLLVQFPGRAVAKDESWMQGEFSDFVELAGLVVVKRTLTLTGVDRQGERRVARIQIRGETPVNFDHDEYYGASHLRLKVTGTMRLTGEVLWLVEEGRMQRFTQDVTIDEPMRVEIERWTVTGRYTYKSTEQLEYMPAKP